MKRSTKKHAAPALPPASDWRTSNQDEILKRRVRAREETFRIENLDPAEPIFSNFGIHSASGMSYRAEIRDIATAQYSCNCTDFRINGLGTCKHIEALLLHLAAEAAGWIPEGSPPEHPLNEAWSCIATASAKLAGALNIHDPEDWPSAPLFAGHALHRLKTARRFLRDALLAIETAAADHLAPAEWTDSIATVLNTEILPQLEHLIAEVRLILNTADQHPDFDGEDLP